MNILITGASRGLGKACVEHFSKEHKVITLDGRKQCDFTKKSEVIKEAKRLSEEYEIDAIIHCAGGGFGMSNEFLSWEEFETLYRVNLVAAATLNKYIIPTMIKRGHGTVIHISSIAARQMTASVGYSAVKAGVSAYVRVLGNKLAGTGVRVSGIIPGTFISEGNNWDRYTKENAEWLTGYINKNCPKGRLGTLEDYLPIIEFLISDKANAFNGCCIPVDNGEGLYV